jgi:hypothetical protein
LVEVDSYMHIITYIYWCIYTCIYMIDCKSRNDWLRYFHICILLHIYIDVYIRVYMWLTVNPEMIGWGIFIYVYYNIYISMYIYAYIYVNRFNSSYIGRFIYVYLSYMYIRMCIYVYIHKYTWMDMITPRSRSNWLR